METTLHLVRFILAVIYIVAILINWGSKNPNVHLVKVILALLLTGISIVIGTKLLIALWGLNFILGIIQWVVCLQKGDLKDEDEDWTLEYLKTSKSTCLHCGTGEEGSCPNCGAPLPRHQQ